MIVYFIAINLIGFIVYGIDKYKAKHHKWRISELTMMILAIIGGSIGTFFGMHIFHHKTKKPLFKWGVPIIILMQVILWYLLKESNISYLFDILLF